MSIPRYTLVAFDRRAFWTIKDEQREKGHSKKPGAAEEERPKFWIFTFSTICRMKEPYTGVDAYPEATMACIVLLKAINNGQMSQGT
jgi:alpha-D-ribose 1-methylphosphonate 5-triphosphate synthase subunit PhnH